MLLLKKIHPLNSHAGLQDFLSLKSLGIVMELKYQQKGGGQYYLMVTSTLYGLCQASARQTVGFIAAKLKIDLALHIAKMHHSSLEVSGSSAIIKI